jgi:hypothetical protein
VLVGHTQSVKELLQAVSVRQLQSILRSFDRIQDVACSSSKFRIEVIQKFEILIDPMRD